MNKKNRLIMGRTVFVLLCAVILLTTIGLVMLYSASMVRGDTQFDNSAHFITRQLIWLALALAAGTICTRINLHWVRKAALPLAVFCVLLLVLVRIPGIGFCINGSWRWLRLGPLTVQPSELAKIGMILAVAWWIACQRRYIHRFKRGLLPALGILGVFGGLLIIEPDLGTTVLFGAVGLTMLLLGGARWLHLCGPAGAGFAAMAIFVMNNENRLRRILAFLDPVKYAQGEAWQLSKGLDAFASGGAFGSGLGNSIQKYHYLPEAHTDFILPIIGEELGLGGSLIVLVLFFVIFICGMRIAAHAADDFGRFTALGITLMITCQALINMFVVTGLAPTKGLPLPFISYGGSSLLASSVMTGLLIDAARTALDPAVRARTVLFKDRCHSG
jgi:cell division protein FtsW